MIKTTLERLNAYYVDYRRLFGFRPAGIAAPTNGKMTIAEYNTHPISYYNTVAIVDLD